MAEKTKEVDAFIARAQPFARPILVKIRKLFHRACPELEEKLKWGMPSFEYKGMLGGMASFKHHATWGLWKSSLVNDPTAALERKTSSMMAAGKYTDVAQLPPDEVIIDLIRQAVVLNDAGVKTPSRMKKPPKPLPKTPPALASALKKNPKAAATFKAFSPSHKREYIEWIAQARQDVTRQRRVAHAIEWMAAGKPRNWKYM